MCRKEQFYGDKQSQQDNNNSTHTHTHTHTHTEVGTPFLSMSKHIPKYAMHLNVGAGVKHTYISIP